MAGAPSSGPFQILQRSVMSNTLYWHIFIQPRLLEMVWDGNLQISDKMLIMAPQQPWKGALLLSKKLLISKEATRLFCQAMVHNLLTGLHRCGAVVSAEEGKHLETFVHAPAEIILCDLPPVSPLSPLYPPQSHGSSDHSHASIREEMEIWTCNNKQIQKLNC